jgi:hypothetical protein
MYQQIAALEVASENPTTVTIFFFHGRGIDPSGGDVSVY